MVFEEQFNHRRFKYQSLFVMTFLFFEYTIDRILKLLLAT
ncbi:hypothetical protein EZS27_018862 [termite gut metagenome]|uniref:Uncharacterized protein n=1 Tax=termite gut metagenome TaxID=433724 RepID=A0A5J4RGN4_9ZZZZ